MFFSPSHKYSAAYGVFGRDNTGWVSAGTKLRFHQGTYNPDSGKLCVIVLQARVRPGCFSVNRQTMGLIDQLDPHYDNEELEWRVANPDENHVVYGVLTKEFDPNDDAERLETIGTQQPVIIGVRTRL